MPSPVPVRASYLVAAAVAALLLLLPFATSQGCVGTIAGVPLHEAADGAAAVGASLQLGAAAIVDPAGSGNILVPVSGGVYLVDVAGALSLLAGGSTAASTDVPVSPATAVTLAGHTLVAASTNGSILIADASSIRRYDANDGRLCLLAGLVDSSDPAWAPDGELAAGAPVSPICLSSDPLTGDPYFCDGPNVVRTIPSTGPLAGRLVTVAGNGSASPSVSGARATETGYSDLRDVFYASPSGDLLLAENDGDGSPRLVRVTRSDGRSRVIAGGAPAPPGGSYDPSSYCSSGAPALGTPLLGVIAVCELSSSGGVYFSDGFRVLAIKLAEGSASAVNATLGVIAGRFTPDLAPVVDGTVAAEADFFALTGLREGRAGSELVVVDSGVGAVYSLHLDTSVLKAIAGSVELAAVVDAAAAAGGNPLATSLPLSGLYDLTIDADTGDIFVPSAAGNAVLRVFAANGTERVIAGNGVAGCSSATYTSDARSVSLFHPSSVALDGRGGLIFGDRRCCLLRRLDLESGAVAVLAGNTTAFCNSPRGPDLPASRGSLAVAVTSIHETNYVVVDPNGDIYWSEDLGYRLLVLRGGVAGSTPLRVAGTGAPGIDEGGSVPAGAVALETDLATPGYIVLDPRGSPVFLDGYLPGRILHLNLTSGALTVIAALQLLPADPGGASFPPVVDGTLATATASALAGLTFIDGGEALLTADTAADSSWSVVRRIDLVRGTVSRVAGTFPGTGGVAVDGHPLLETMFNYISAVAVWPGGSIAVADTGTSLIRVGLSSNASSAFCPGGFSCPCGRPLPCTDPERYCPPNQLAPSRVARGFYAVASSTGPTALYSAQAPCPIGSYCAAGLLAPCPPGTFGVARLQGSSAGCPLCPAGTYSASPGAVGAASCLPCPEGSYAEAPGSAFCKLCPHSTRASGSGANSSSACVACSLAGDLTALPGSGSCVSLPTSSIYSSSSVASIHIVVPPASTTRDTTPLLVAACFPIAFIAALPWLHLATVRICCKDRSLCGGTQSRGRERRIRHWQPVARWLSIARSCLIRIDAYGLQHYVYDGTYPIKLRTSFGGALTTLAIGCIGALVAALVIQYLFANVLLTTTLLPAPFPTLSGFVSVPAHDVGPGGLPAIAPSSSTRGLELRVATMGPLCGAAIFSAEALLHGKFTALPVLSEPTTSSWKHAFICLDCVFGPLTSVSVTFSRACQSFRIDATAVGATGSISVASISASSASPAPPNASAPVLATLGIVIPPQLEVVDDPVRGIHERGYSVDTQLVSRVEAVSPAATTLNINLAVSASYVRINTVRVTGLAQLLSSIIGLAGIIGFFGYVFRALELCCVRTRRVVEALDAVRSTRTEVTGRFSQALVGSPSPMFRARGDATSERTASAVIALPRHRLSITGLSAIGVTINVAGDTDSVSPNLNARRGSASLFAGLPSYQSLSTAAAAADLDQDAASPASVPMPGSIGGAVDDEPGLPP